MIYTHQNLDVMVASNNWLSIEDQGMGQEFSDENITGMLNVVAFWAVRSDIEEYIERYKDEYFKEENPRRKKKRKNPQDQLKNRLLR